MKAETRKDIWDKTTKFTLGKSEDSDQEWLYEANHCGIREKIYIRKAPVWEQIKNGAADIYDHSNG